MRTSALQIRTPEGIAFSQLLAAPVTRFLAWLVDLCCIAVLFIGFGVLIGLLQLLSANLGGAVATLGYFFISIGYGIACEWGWRGQTVGKKLLRLRVVDAEGLRLQFNQIVTRNLLRFVDSLPLFYFVGGVVCWLSPKCQRLGDLAANTIVVRHPRLAQPDLDQLLAGKYNSLRQYPRLAARLRQSVSPAESALALQALLRREQFDPLARLELFAGLAAHFRAKTDFPEETIEGITDEQFVRNIVDLIYRTLTESRPQRAAA
ncbi:MAG TPA: RDD family protein [Verrucomicrobiae bacterium]|nr:RDD family protein [Verrucomicrobiae bacterium]